MKNLKNKLISCVLAVVTACTVFAATTQKKTITAYAASNEEFLSEVALVYEDSAEEAQQAISGTGWKLFNKDLNPNADAVFDDGVYLIYKTSTNVEDAITDLRVMDMYGGYSTTNYKQQLEKSKTQYTEAIVEFRQAADEFAALYNAGDGMAKLAYRQMNYYKDVKTENGTETDMKMGDFFLKMPKDEQIVQMMMEGNSIVVANLVSLLAVGISGGSTSLSQRIAEKYAIKDALSDTDYHESAKLLSSSFETIKAKLIRFDALQEEYDLEDENMSDEAYTFLTEFATISDLLTTISVGETTLGEFIRGTWVTKDLYPIVAAFTPGQKALVEMGQLETVLKYNSPSKSLADLTKAVEDMEGEMKAANNGVLPVYDVYTGVDREIFKGDFAMTTEAQRQQALTGKTWDASAAAGLSGGQLAGFIVAGVVDLALAGAAAGIAIKAAVLQAALTTARFAYVRATAATVADATTRYVAAKTALYGTWVNPNAGFMIKWGWMSSPLAVMAAAATLIIAGAYGITTWYNYYNPDYLEIPNTLIDVKETDLGDKYVKYSAAKVFNGEEGQEVADFNAYEGKEWIALYYTKDATAGNCLTPNFVYRENNSTVSKRHQGVSMFGESNAFNLNSHVYNDDAKGIYLTVRYSTAKKAAADMPSVVGSILGGAYYVLTAVGGAGVGIGCMALVQKAKKKKKEEEAEAEAAQEEIPQEEVIQEETVQEEIVQEETTTTDE